MSVTERQVRKLENMRRLLRFQLGLPPFNCYIQGASFRKKKVGTNQIASTVYTEVSIQDFRFIKQKKVFTPLVIHFRKKLHNRIIRSFFLEEKGNYLITQRSGNEEQ
jgi:hypothetical protein